MNIQTATSGAVKQAAGAVLAHEQAQRAVNDRLGLKDPVKLGGYEIQDWVDDLSKRMHIIDTREQLDRLDATEVKLNDLMSPEKKREREIDAIGAQLSL